MNSKKIILSIVLGLVVIAAVAGGYMLYNKQTLKLSNKTNDVVKIPNNPKKGDVGYQEKQTTLQADNKDKFASLFVKVEDNKITIKKGEEYQEYPLTEEIAVQCTTQPLVDAKSVNLDLVTKVNVLSPEQIGATIAADTPVFLIGSVSGDKLSEVHTLLVPASSCN